MDKIDFVLADLIALDYFVFRKLRHPDNFIRPFETDWNQPIKKKQIAFFDKLGKNFERNVVDDRNNFHGSRNEPRGYVLREIHIRRSSSQIPRQGPKIPEEFVS